MSWQESPLREIALLNYGKSLPEGDRTEGDVPVYGSGGITGSHNEALVRGPGVVVGRKGTVGAVYWESRDFFPIDTVYYAEPVRESIDKRFLYYLLKSLPLASMNSDAAVPGLSRENAYALRVRVPDPDSQVRIVAMLSAYDDLIENNRRRIALLEQSARLLYREWFVHLRFPGHEHVKVVDGVPEGWERKPLGDVLTLQRGFDLPTGARVEGEIPIYAATGVHGCHNKAMVNGPGVITGRSGSLGTVSYSPGDFWPLNTTLWVKEFKRVAPEFAYFLLSILGLEQYNGGVAVPTLNRNDVHRIQINLPSQTLMDEFNEFALLHFKQVATLTQQNEKLRQARDLLLPRLMSGDLAV